MRWQMSFQSFSLPIESIFLHGHDGKAWGWGKKFNSESTLTIGHRCNFFWGCVFGGKRWARFGTKSTPAQPAIFFEISKNLKL